VGGGYEAQTLEVRIHMGSSAECAERRRMRVLRAKISRREGYIIYRVEGEVK